MSVLPPRILFLSSEAMSARFGLITRIDGDSFGRSDAKYESYVRANDSTTSATRTSKYCVDA